MPDVSSVVEKILRGFQDRRNRLLRRLAGGETIAPEKLLDPAEDWYGDRALANVMLGRYLPQANAHLRHVAGWFDHPHPAGRLHDGECDFAAIRLARAYYLSRDAGAILEPETILSVLDFFRKRRFESRYLSENHALIFRVSRYLMSKAMRSQRLEAYHRTGDELLDEDARWLEKFIRYRARQGWGEFDSAVYFSAQWECMAALYDFSGRIMPTETPAEPQARDCELHRLSGMMLDLLLADMTVDSLQGMYCGAHGRIYPEQALDHASEATRVFQYLYFGFGNPESLGHFGIDVVTGAHRPDELLVRMAREQSLPYQNFERKHLHNIFDECPIHPIDGSIRKYSYCTPHYVLGSVQHQDPYPAEPPGGRMHHPEDPNPIGWYARHQQHQWDLSFMTNTRARLFTHHPGDTGEHNHWTGDRGCDCGRFLQHRAALLAIYRIPSDQPCQFIHAYLPRDVFDELIDENDIVFVRAGGAFGSLRILMPWRWTIDGPWKNMELCSDGARHGIVCEAGLASDFDSFADFRKQILANRIEFDVDALSLTYISTQAGSLHLSWDGRRRIDDEDQCLDYPAFRSPYIFSEWNSGVVAIAAGDERRVLDFRDQREQ